MEPWPRPVVEGGVFEVHAVVLVEVYGDDFPVVEDGEPRETGAFLGGVLDGFWWDPVAGIDTVLVRLTNTVFGPVFRGG